MQVSGPNFLRPFAGREELRVFEPRVFDVGNIDELGAAIAELQLAGEVTIRRPEQLELDGRARRPRPDWA